MRVLVTGGAGFIGNHVCRLLANRGHEVIAFDNMSTGSIASLLDVNVEVIVGDVRDPGALSDACLGTDALVHLAAVASVSQSIERPTEVHDVNVTGTVNALDAARRHGAHFVLTSSAAVYGHPLISPIREEFPTAPVSPYGASKVAAEGYGLAYAAAYGLPVLALRLFNVYGPGQNPPAAVPALINAVRAGIPLPIHGDGQQRRDFVYVGDVAGIVAEAIERRFAADRPVNVGSGSGTSIADLGRHISVLAGTELAADREPARAGDIRDSVADITRLRQLLPFSPTSLGAGLAHTYHSVESDQVSGAHA